VSICGLGPFTSVGRLEHLLERKLLLGVELFKAVLLSGQLLCSFVLLLQFVAQYPLVGALDPSVFPQVLFLFLLPQLAHVSFLALEVLKRILEITMNISFVKQLLPVSIVFRLPCLLNFLQKGLFLLFTFECLFLLLHLFEVLLLLDPLLVFVVSDSSFNILLKGFKFLVVKSNALGFSALLDQIVFRPSSVDRSRQVVSFQLLSF
jgi:hypothetical protein